MPLENAPYLHVARGEVARGAAPSRTPVWFMRQAGRSLPEYRRVREGTTMLESCRRPELVTEITLQPVRRYDVDAAVFYSDIVVPLEAAGVGVEIVPGTGPVIAEPIRTRADLDRLPELHLDQLAHVSEAVRLTTAELAGIGGGVPLIGFAGAPFTLASYLVEGGPSRDLLRTKALMHADPQLWHDLAGRLAQITGTFLRAQVLAGASAVQLFDSWVGSVPLADYERLVAPHSAAALAAVGDLGVPRTHFGTGTGELLGAMAAVDGGVDVLGVDFRVPLDVGAARGRAGAGRPVAVQGNLDPAMLFAPWEVLRADLHRVLAEGERAGGGHVVNLGHGVPPSADPDVLARVVQEVHAWRR
ncbi:uroporphyrinogen decarboxylase [Kineococcus sp. T13]|uniref:uroporphyrinogen decarboxylase n=1 Tax=Kineococcus vitellinus TaxID=2696565 RepID=UPI00141203CA|nr:uroporphyrinogen decarboxylase [Kineococcus vitellinus]